MIAVLGKYREYEHLCYHCNINPKSNDVFKFIDRQQDAAGHVFSTFVAVGDLSQMNYNDQMLLDFVMTRVRPIR